MPNKPTKYERVVSIIPEEQKKALVAYGDANNIRITSIIREALELWAKKKGIKI